MLIKNSFILSAVFILVCGFFFLTTTETVNAQPISDCCVANGGVGCDNQTCEDIVCGQDAFCCDTEWDGLCAGAAEDLCEVCAGEFATSIELEPREAVNEVFTDHTVTATVLVNGVPTEGVNVFFEIISGPNEGEVSDGPFGSGVCNPSDCDSDENGLVTWTYSSSLLGVDTILASSEGADSNTVEKEWIVVRNIPTLSEWGMISTAAILGLIGFFFILARKRRALS